MRLDQHPISEKHATLTLWEHVSLYPAKMVHREHSEKKAKNKKIYLNPEHELSCPLFPINDINDKRTTTCVGDGAEPGVGGPALPPPPWTGGVQVEAGGPSCLPGGGGGWPPGRAGGPTASVLEALGGAEAGIGLSDGGGGGGGPWLGCCGASPGCMGRRGGPRGGAPCNG